jgi:hypothetical protein
LSDKELRELDKAVAEAFGFKPNIVWAVLNADESALMIDFEREAAARKWWDEHPSVHKDHHLGTLKIYQPYSSSIEAAMRVVDKMRERDWYVEIANMSTEWFVNFIYDINERIDCPAQARLLPEAICRAALAAIETKQENE